jgi:Rrf2 family cysteine metabolism transcriptional repressor
MRLSARGQYGVRAVVELAFHFDRGYLPLREIARAKGISPSYLEHVLRALRQAGLVVSARGARGGYRLAFPPDEITVGRIVRALEGPIAPVVCASEEGTIGCDQAADCSSRAAWLRLRDGIAAALDAMTIADLIDDPEATTDSAG